MPERNLHDDLDALARYAATTGELRTAADVRGRGDRRRRNSAVTAGALTLAVAAVLGYGFVQIRPDAGPDPVPANSATPSTPRSASASASPSASPSASRSASPSASPSRPAGSTIPGRDRKLMIVMADDPLEQALTVSADETIGVYPSGADTGDREEFVLTPLSPGKAPYHLETAVLAAGGENYCIAAPGPAAELKATGCDADADAQKLTLTPDGTAEGRTAYRLTLGGLRVTVTAAGQEPDRVTGENGAGTRFVLVDMGKAPARAGD
jgi:hypothetical protein